MIQLTDYLYYKNSAVIRIIKQIYSATNYLFQAHGGRLALIRKVASPIYVQLLHQMLPHNYSFSEALQVKKIFIKFTLFVVTRTINIKIIYSLLMSTSLKSVQTIIFLFFVLNLTRMINHFSLVFVPIYIDQNIKVYPTIRIFVLGSFFYLKPDNSYSLFQF